MNKKGQVLVFFIAIIPVIILVFAIVIDVGLMYNAKVKGEDLLSDAINNSYDIKDYFDINNINVLKYYRYSQNSNECYVVNYNIDSVFGSIIVYKEYKIKIDSCE